MVSQHVPGKNGVGDEAGEFIAGPLDGLLVLDLALGPPSFVLGGGNDDLTGFWKRDRVDLEIAVLPLLEGVAEDGRGEPVAFSLVTEIAGRDEIGMVVNAPFR